MDLKSKVAAMLAISTMHIKNSVAAAFPPKASTLLGANAIKRMMRRAEEATNTAQYAAYNATVTTRQVLRNRSRATALRIKAR